MDNTTSTPLDAELVPGGANTPAMATQIETPTSVLNGHTPPIGEAYGDGATPTDLNASIEGKGDGKGSWTPGFRAQTAPERALKWDRYFTQPGQDAFDTIDWEMRSAGITGEDGKSVFEQTGCEIPKPWSQLATNVVVSKYFRGPINSPQRETSVRQVIGRVADTIGLWGAQGGYFASDEDTASFREELAYLLVHQYGAFNSPVWFNLGVKDARQQCSACQPYDALVSTPAGLIPIGELVEKNAVGHQVYDANGVARIVATKHNGRKEVLRLHLKSGYTLDVTADHLVWKMNSSGGKWVAAGTLQADDLLSWHRAPSTDKSQQLGAEVAEAALAGWLQSDGFVGRYTSGTNKSLTIEAMTVNAAEEKWVRAALEAVFPDAHSHTRTVVTQDENLDCKRIRVYGDFMEPFIEKWNLMPRGNAMTVPPMLYTAPLPVVVAYLRSLFQAEGYVSVRDNAVIALDMVSEGIVRGVQSLLGRLGIYARVRFKQDARADRQGCWSLGIRPRGDRELFATEIGFIAPDKQDKVMASLKLAGHEVTARKTMQIERIEVRGEMDVYDIQTTSGEYLSNGLRVHNCFINDVYDDMESIMELAATEARLFKGGSGAGVNLWRIRSSKEHLRGGGIASGPISFMRGWDAFAGAVKSGGTCLAPHQRVYTAQGPVPVVELAEREEFVALSFDPPANRYKAKRARAWLAGRKEVVRVTTDKGAFELSFDHPVKLSSGEYVQAGSLAEGMSLFACTIDTQHGHLRVGLRDGKKGKEFLHRLVAADVMNEDLEGLVVHHRDENRLNNTPENLQVMTQAEHAALHGRAVAARGQHVFQTQEFSHAGADNGMHRDSAFWQTEAADVYRDKQGEILKDSGRAAEMQREAARQKTLNTAFRVLNAGWDIDTFERYVTGRKLIVGRIASIVQLREQIEAEFGSYDEFVREVARANHRVTSVETIGEMEVYDVEVQCPTPDDKSPQTGHNFLIWDGDEPTGSGVVVANTRRAAKMVILNSDHPDIGEFITCKADEEKKAWALIEAGYNGGFNVPGGAYDSVAFQNANHSVRVTDEFMRAAESDGQWNLRAVTTGKTVDTVSARQMLKDIAQTTWICGDPGMQFDTIINDWHTCANSDRIYASNPCSEFMFLNSTACNLASLNLLKFYNMETGEFDAAAYSRACETFLTAQEIIVSFASYPTQKIGEMSEEYRPLGLGYANLGALLMAKGLAYDSDEGRALAGALTAIMTGAGYRKSAQIARNTGPFEGYAKNKEPMLRVIAKHRDAVNSIDAGLVAQNVMDEARRVWDDAYMTGQKYGYRNSQATVLAPTGCLVAGSLVSTDRGLVRLERLGNPDGAQWQDADFRVYTDGGVQNATQFFINGIEETRVITTQAGYSIQGTGKHRVKVVNARTGVWEWKHFRDLETGDLLPLAMNTLIGEAQEVILPPLGQLHWNGEWKVRVPAHMTADLAELVGYFMGDGSLHAKGLRFCVAQGDDDVAARLSALGHELFGLEAHLTQQKGYVEVTLNSVCLAHWWDAASFTKATPSEGHRGKGYVPRVPDAVLHSNDAAIYSAFLRGLYEADGTNTLGVPSVSTAHKTFADEIRSLLLALGFPTSSKVDASQWGNSNLHVQRLRNGSYNPQWLSKIGFMGARKTAGVIELKGEMSGKGDRVFLPRAVWDELVPAGHPLRSAMVIALKRHGGVARGLASQIYAQTGDPRVAHVLNYFFNEVQSNEDGGQQMTYDLSVPTNVTYVANGFVSHNTISFMMDCDTTGVEPDIALVKYKKLVGGGLLKIVNQTVPAALRNLGYDETEIKTIVEYIDKNDTIEGAPGLNDEHLPVFDCAFKAMNGTRSIHHMGHIKMMAATQPFISGAISKTVNMPQDCTADEIYDAYLQSWKLGVKAVAIYRDGSKRTQPLSTASDAQKAEKADKKEAEIRRAARRKLPDERNSITHKFSIAGQEGYFMVGLYEDGSPGEIFIKMSKEGSTISGLMDSFAVAVSMCLQYGVPLRVLVNKFSHTRFEPSGYTTNRDIPIAKSLMDYIFRWFDLKFHPNGDNGYAGKAEGAPQAATPTASANSSLFANGEVDNHGNVGNAQREISQMQQDAPPCPDCGALTVRSGACYKCNECGATTGCG